MKVGILTYHWVSNMGANLQAFSTYKYLENNGYNPIIINWIPSDLKEYYVKNVPAQQILAHEQFAKESFISITLCCETDEQIAREIEKHEIDCIVVGSDAVFSIKPFFSRLYIGRKGFKYLTPCSDGRFPNPFWGSFMSNLKHPIKLVSLSASAQNSPYKKMTGIEKANYRKALSLFDKLTVRDVWTQSMIRMITDGNTIPSIFPDPVFAFNQNVNPAKRCIVEKQLHIKNKYVLLSISSSIKNIDWILELEHKFNNVGISLVGLPKTIGSIVSPLKYNLSYPMSPLDWYDAIKYSEGFVGELMHPVLVALHNAVPVFAFDTYGFKKFGKLNKDSSKTYQIMSRFNLVENNYYNRIYNSFPTAEKVFRSIINFDKNLVRQQSDIMYDEYIKMMKYILE